MNARSAAACQRCGQALGRIDPGLKGERRQITLFFSDLVGSTALSERIDPEELQRLYAEYQQACGEVVNRYGGYVAQFLGDGILAYFGFPTAHGDDAARAVRTGIELLHRLGQTEVGRSHAAVRIGIHTGLVVVGGAGGDSRREPLALGEAPNVAARLQSEAQPDTLVVSEATRRLLGGQFMLEPLGAHTLKGISRPMQIYQVLGRNQQSTRLALLSAAGIEFKGRERELEQIRDTWSQACTNSSRALLIRGEAGIGKSRLLGMAREIARDQLHEVFEVECSPYDMSSALYPIVSMLRRRLGLESTQSPQEMVEVLERFAAGRDVSLEEALPLLAELFGIPVGDRYPQLELPPARRRQRTLVVLAELLQHPRDGVPVLMLIEDLHWADPSTLELIRALLAQPVDAPLLLVCTTRPESKLEIEESPILKVLELTPLSHQAARELIRSHSGRKPLPEAVESEIIERTGGVPLFVEAVTRMILESGVLQDSGDRYELVGTLPEALIPDTVHDSLMARIDRLGPDRAIVQIASVIGRQFDLKLLELVSGHPRADLLQALVRLEHLDMVTESEGSTPAAPVFLFRHALIQDVAYESLLRTTRQGLHLSMAQALKTHFPEVLAERPELLAQHYARAGSHAEAVEYWLKAGQLALGQAANHEAITHLRQGLTLIEHVLADQRLARELDFRATLAPALTATQGWVSEELAQTYRRAGELLDLLPDSPHRLPVLWGTWAYHFVAGNVGDSLALAPQVLQLATAVGNPLLIPPARHATACSHTYHADFPEALQHAQAGLSVFDFEREQLIARNFGHASSVCLESFQGDALWMIGLPDQALAASDRSLELARRLQHMPSLAWAVSYKTWFHHLLRDPQRILDMADEAIRLAGEEGFAFWEPMVAVYRGWALTVQGDAEQGLTSMRGGLARYRAAGNGCTQIHMLAALAEALWIGGQHDEAFGVLREGMGVAKTTEEGFYEPELYRLRGQFQLDQARQLLPEALERQTLLMSAEKTIRLSAEMARFQGARSLELRSLTSLCELLIENGSDVAVMDTATQALAQLLDSFTEGLETPDLCQARALLARLRP
jgi:class 3 adenylate cyclase/tetratricopeptide (TPR) repeat protein